MPTNEMVLFLDTNSLLHYPPINDVDWKAVAGTGTVRLVLCLQVVDELDSKKSDPRLSKRAARVIKEIESLLEQAGAVADGVLLEVFPYGIRAADFPDTLSPENPDDRIVHTVKKYLAGHPTAQAAVYSEDMGMGLRCKHHSIAVIKPDTSSRLTNPASEEEKKYQSAITELNNLKNRVPKLELVIAKPGAVRPDKELLLFDLPPLPVAPDLDAELREYAQAKGLQPMKKIHQASSIYLRGLAASEAFQQAGRFNDAIEEFNTAIQKHLHEYKEWLEARETLGVLDAHTLRFSIWLTNNGTTPADDLDLEIELPNLLSHVFEANGEEAELFKLPDAPNPPSPPGCPLPIDDFGRDIMSPHFGEPELVASQLPNLSRDGLGIAQHEDEGPFRLTYSCQRLKHHDHVHVGHVVAIIRSDSVRPFQAGYRVTVANPVQPVTGELHFVVRRSG
jgi:hypothetical protein